MGTAPSRAGTRHGGHGQANHIRPAREIPGARASFPYAFGVTSTGVPARRTRVRLAARGPTTSTDLVLEVGLGAGGCRRDSGAVLRWERGLVVLEDRHGKQRTFVLGAGFWCEEARSCSRLRREHGRCPPDCLGSVVGPADRAKTALASRILSRVATTPSWWKIWGATCAMLGASRVPRRHRRPPWRSG
jgi:hypothetical protein